MNYALIGCGRIAGNHIDAALANGLDIVAVCDIEHKKTTTLLETKGLTNKGVVCFTDFEHMLEACPGIELVAIATESGLHASIARACIRAGKHLVIEKPIALSMEDADEIVRLAEQNGVVVSACHQNRFNLAVRKTREAVEAGRFGNMSHGSVHVRWNRGKSYYDQASWRGTWAQDGGCLMNQCIHGIDLLRWLMGSELVSVYAQTRRRFHDYIEAEDIGAAVLGFADGSLATVEGTVNVFPQNLEETLYLFGETGTVKLGGKSTNTIDAWDFADAKDDDAELHGFHEATVDVYGNGHQALYADVVEAIRQGREPYVSAKAGRDAVEVILAIYKSQKTGQPVSLPLEDFASLDMSSDEMLR